MFVFVKLMISSWSFKSFIQVSLLYGVLIGYYFLIFKLTLIHSTDLVDSSGLRFWYTNQTRMYDAGIIFTGWGVTHQMIIPPKQPQWETEGYCAGICTKKVGLFTHLRT